MKKKKEEKQKVVVEISLVFDKESKALLKAIDRINNPKKKKAKT